MENFIFLHIYQPGVSITVPAYNFTNAYERLVSVAKHPADYKIKETEAGTKSINH